MVVTKKTQTELVQSQMLFNLSAAARILGLGPFSILKVTRTENELYEAVDLNQNIYTIPKESFLLDFVSTRQSRSQNLLIEPTKYSNVWIVTNPENKNRYPVRAVAQGIECKCQDYQKQQSVSGRGCCKHGYRLLAHLGHPNLNSYLAAQQAVAS